MNPETNCTSCGDNDRNPNPLDACTRSFLGCDNPCAIVEHNTVACESLPSRVENFTKNFFGDVIRTEVNGQVVWSLPCGLDVGLPANPRGADEGLACYFLRLFNDGIVGLTGEAGQNGIQGPAGHNAYTVTLQSFVTPGVGGSVTVRTFYNPAMLVGAYVLVDTSGWYIITGADLFGNLTLQLIIASPGAGFVSSGKLVVPSGAPGQSVTGPKGDQGIQGPRGIVGPQGATGDKGDTGPAGDSLLANNGYSTGFGGSNYNIPNNTFSTVNFGSSFGFTATAQGMYIVVATFGVVNGSGSPTISTFQIFNETDSISHPGSQSQVYLLAGEEAPVMVTDILNTGGINKSIVLQASSQAAAANSVVAAHSSMLFFQIA